MKANPIALGVALALVACGSSAPGGTPADKLFEAVAPSSVAVVDIGSKSVDRKLGLGVPSPDWRHLYSVAGTTLVDTNPGDGAIQRSLSLGGAYALPATSAVGVPGGMSADGRWLVVEATAGGTTRLAVIATA